jgi:flagellar hook-basal body complex protein FliE|tara:strand:+ start:178 stop:507 length:330 start_codon:yes stop_codon:yes gene_type:complete
MKVQGPNITSINNSLAKIKQQTESSVQALSTSQKADGPSFSTRISDGLNEVAKTQNDASQLAKDFELGTENDLSKVMVSQQISSVGFQLTLNVRNKALSAYKDIMNMPV